MIEVLQEWEQCLAVPARPTGDPQDDDIETRQHIRDRCLADVRALILLMGGR